MADRRGLKVAGVVVALGDQPHDVEAEAEMRRVTGECLPRPMVDDRGIALDPAWLRPEAVDCDLDVARQAGQLAATGLLADEVGAE